MRRQVYFYTYLQGDPPAVGEAFAGDPARWLPLPAEVGDGGFEVELDAGDTVPGRLGRHRASVEVDAEPLRLDGQIARHLTWRSAEHNGWLPTLEADLELTCTSPSVCQLALLGSYQPPLSVIGNAVDSAYGHRVAEAVVRAFVLAVAARLATITATTAP